MKTKETKLRKRRKRQKEAAKEAATERRCERTAIRLEAVTSMLEFTIYVYNYYCIKGLKRYWEKGLTLTRVQTLPDALQDDLDERDGYKLAWFSGVSQRNFV